MRPKVIILKFASRNTRGTRSHQNLRQPLSNGSKSGFSRDERLPALSNGYKEIYETLSHLLLHIGSLLHSPALRELLWLGYQIQRRVDIQCPEHRLLGTPTGCKQGFTTRRRRDGSIPARLN